jgi:hypothetical protein
MGRAFAINSVANDYGFFTEKDLYYKESAINARNPVHEADSLERSFIKKLDADLNLTTESTIRKCRSWPFTTS